MKSPFGPFTQFQPANVEELLARHRATMTRRLHLHRRRLSVLHRDAIARADSLLEKAHDLTHRMARAEDIEANKADRLYGADKWRRNRRLLKLVAGRMAKRTGKLLAKRVELHERAYALRRPYLLARWRLDRQFIAASGLNHGAATKRSPRR